MLQKPPAPQQKTLDTSTQKNSTFAMRKGKMMSCRAICNLYSELGYEQVAALDAKGAGRVGFVGKMIM